MPRSGLTMARTGTLAACSRSMTPLQPEPSAKAPWTRTTVTGPLAEFVSVIVFLSRRAGAHNPALTGLRHLPGCCGVRP